MAFPDQVCPRATGYRGCKSSLPKTQEDKDKKHQGRTKRWKAAASPLLSAWGPCTARGRRLISACRTPVCLPPCREAWCREASGTYIKLPKLSRSEHTHGNLQLFVIQQLTQGQLQMLMGPGLSLCHWEGEFSPIPWVCFPNLALFAGRLFAPSCQIVFQQL